MRLKDLMSGIGVVIDDSVSPAAADRDAEDAPVDPIEEIVRQIEDEWELACYTTSEMPAEGTWPSLLRSASFILLDWKLWPTGSSLLEKYGIQKNIQFLKTAKDYFVPVLIFTTESVEDVVSKLPKDIYSVESPEKSFVFVRNKTDLLSGGSVNFSDIKNWVRRNASVYALKTWESVFHAARRELFGSMYARSSEWPRVFWKAYEDDGVDPSSSLTHLINDNLRGRMRTSEFNEEILGAPHPDVPKDELRALIGEASFRPQNALRDDEIGCGDMFQLPKQKFLLNLRPDCDCVPRNGQKADEMELYCIEGKKMRDSDLEQQYEREQGHFTERVWEQVVFSVHEAKSVRFDFRKLRIEKFSSLREKRIGRLLHPYLTRIQQRFGQYQQRQGLPRIPADAVHTLPTPSLGGGES